MSDQHRYLIVGSGAREAAIATKLCDTESVSLFAILPNINPTIKGLCDLTDGTWLQDSDTNNEAIVRFARSHGITRAFVSADSPLAAGVCDSLLNIGIPTVGAIKSAARIEWDKAFARTLLSLVAPKSVPRFWVCETIDQIADAFTIAQTSGTSLVIKPQGLTAGKGVKLMGLHFDGYESAKDYAMQILTDKIGDSHAVILEEKVSGPEFTLQVFTDGRSVKPMPLVFDYPYRYDGDQGPGTGGMGSFTESNHLLPFANKAQYENAIEVVTRVINELDQRGHTYTGVFYAGLFATEQGLKVCEFNSRFGDPECINVLSLLETPLTDVLEAILTKSLDDLDVQFRKEATVVKYLVPPEYAVAKPCNHDFVLDQDGIASLGVKTYFGAAIEADGTQCFRTIGASRSVALLKSAETREIAAQKIDDAIARFVQGPLEYRRDVGARFFEID